MNIDYTVQIWKEGDQYIAHAMPLDVMSAGATPEAARLALDEAVQLFLTVAKERDTLEEILEETGYIFREEQWLSPEWVSTEKHSIQLVA
jgi:predicted RNase H-like HicB family nuclease